MASNAKVDEVIGQVKTAVTSGRTDVLNSVLEGCGKFGLEGTTLREKILDEVVVSEGTFLHLATKLGLQDVVRTLLIAGADPTIENKNGENPYELAQAENIQQVYVEELLRATALSNLGRMEKLFKAGMDVNSVDCEEKRNSILHWAVSFANAETVSYLIERGSDVNAVTTEVVTPLHDAVDRGDVEIIEALLRANASPLIKAENGKFEGQSPLDLAARKPEIFPIMSHYLAAQVRPRTLAKRCSSIDSVSGLTNGPESPPYNAESIRSSIRERSFSTAGIDTYTGFNSNLESVIRGLEVKGPIQPIVTDPLLSNLWPQPKQLLTMDGPHFKPDKVLHVSVVKGNVSVHRILDVFSHHKDEFENLGLRATCSAVEETLTSNINQTYSSHIQCCINPNILPVPNSYRLHVSSQKIRVTASDILGFRYAVSTFLQLLTLYSHENERISIPPLIINDFPSLKHRGIFIDVSHERIPTLASLCELIRQLSSLKINYLHLHMRFDKSGALVSYTKGEIVAIDRHCDDVGITLIPAIDVPCDLTASDYFNHIKPVLHDVLPCFATSRYVHLGPQLTTLIFSQNEGDEIRFSSIWDFIPLSPSDSVVFLCYNAVRTRLSNTTLLLNVPSNVVIVEYGFQADYNFGPSVQELTQSGCTTCVCAGTSSWSSLAGCPEAALCNIYHATINAVNNASLGLIVVNWSGRCNLTSRIFAWPGYILTAGLSWNHLTHWEYLQGSLASLMNTYVLGDQSGLAGQVVLQLGCAETTLLRASLNQSPSNMSNLPPAEGTTLYKLLTDPDTVPLEFLTMESIIKCIRSIKKCQNLLLESKISKEHNPTFDELCLSMELMLLGCRIGRCLLSAGVNPRSNMGLTCINLGISNLPPTARTDIANKLLILTEEYQKVWMQHSFPQGLETSLYTLTTTLQRFIPDSTRIITGRLRTTSITNGI